jgi:Ca-activated chloride channel family protein
MKSPRDQQEAAPGNRIMRWTARGACLGLALALIIGSVQDPEFWFTSDQQGDRRMNSGRPAAAAELYRDPLRAGIAWYRAGEFEKAAGAFLRPATPEARYNRGNALVFLGRYSEAVDAYDAALRDRPSWPEATANREVARLRAESLRAEGGEMTGGKLAADEIVFDEAKKGGSSDESETVQGGDQMSDAELKALWLRRIQTKPADFLRAKFAWQAAAAGENK